MPKKRARIGIVRVNAIVFAGYKYNVALCGVHGQVPHIKRFRIHFSVRGKDKEFPKRIHGDVARVQDCLIQVLTGAGVVIVIGQDILCGARNCV